MGARTSNKPLERFSGTHSQSSTARDTIEGTTTSKSATTLAEAKTKTGPLALSTLLNVGAENTKARTMTDTFFCS